MMQLLWKQPLRSYHRVLMCLCIPLFPQYRWLHKFHFNCFPHHAVLHYIGEHLSFHLSVYHCYVLENAGYNGQNDFKPFKPETTWDQSFLAWLNNFNSMVKKSSPHYVYSVAHFCKLILHLKNNNIVHKSCHIIFICPGWANNNAHSFTYNHDIKLEWGSHQSSGHKKRSSKYQIVLCWHM